VKGVLKMKKIKFHTICPECGNKKWFRKDDGFECAACGEFCYPEDMSIVSDDCEGSYRRLKVNSPVLHDPSTYPPIQAR
jgi:ribosomal protein L37E